MTSKKVAAPFIPAAVAEHFALAAAKKTVACLKRKLQEAEKQLYSTQEESEMLISSLKNVCSHSVFAG